MGELLKVVDIIYQNWNQNDDEMVYHFILKALMIINNRTNLILISNLKNIQNHSNMSKREEN